MLLTFETVTYFHTYSMLHKVWQAFIQLLYMLYFLLTSSILNNYEIKLNHCLMVCTYVIAGLLQKQYIEALFEAINSKYEQAKSLESKWF